MTLRSVLITAAGMAGPLPVGVAVLGCGVAPADQQVCTLQQRVAPQVATVNHVAAAPGDQVPFSVAFYTTKSGCALPALSVSSAEFAWSSSDAVNAPISNAKDATAGEATCKGATVATISAVLPGSTAVIAPATLTCQ